MNDSVLSRILDTCQEHGIIVDERDGFTPISPSVIMFSGLKLDPYFKTRGVGRQRRFVALIGETICIELYENQVNV